MKKIIKQLFLLLSLGTASANAQVNIGATVPAHASAQLEVTSTQKGLLPPRMTQAQRNAIATPAAGLVVYNTTEKCLNFYNGTGWKSFCNGTVDFITRPIKYRLGGSGTDQANSIQQTSDGGYIMAGSITSSASGDMTGTTKGGEDIWVVKLNASGAISWEKNYGGSGSDTASSIQQTSDGGYIIAGYTNSSASGDVTGTNKGITDAWVVKLTGSGAISWQNNYGGNDYDIFRSIQQTSDGGYIMAGYTLSSASGDVTGTSKGNRDAWVVKLNPSGTISWQKNYGGSGIDSAESIQLTSDGGYIVEGRTASSASGDVTSTTKGGTDYWAIKLTALGAISWQNNYGGSADDYAYSILQTSDGGYIMTGNTLSSASGDVTGTTIGSNDVWVVKLTDAGAISWQKNYGGSGIDSAESIQQTSDGGYIMAGSTYSSASGNVTGTTKGGEDVWVVKLTASGAISWQNNYGGIGRDYAKSIRQTADGNYIVTGTSAHASAGNGDQAGVVSRGGFDIWFFTIDENGAILAP